MEQIDQKEDSKLSNVFNSMKSSLAAGYKHPNAKLSHGEMVANRQFAVVNIKNMAQK